jgi:hypothetical protein
VLFFLSMTTSLHVVFRMPPRAFWIFSTAVLFAPFVALLVMPGVAQDGAPASAHVTAFGVHGRQRVEQTTGEVVRQAGAEGGRGEPRSGPVAVRSRVRAAVRRRRDVRVRVSKNPASIVTVVVRKALTWGWRIQVIPLLARVMDGSAGGVLGDSSQSTGKAPRRSATS